MDKSGVKNPTILNISPLKTNESYCVSLFYGIVLYLFFNNFFAKSIDIQQIFPIDSSPASNK